MTMGFGQAVDKTLLVQALGADCIGLFGASACNGGFRSPHMDNVVRFADFAECGSSCEKHPKEHKSNHFCCSLY